MKTIELTTHVEASQVHLFSDNGQSYGNGGSMRSAIREACFIAQRNGYDSLRIDGGDSFDAAAKIVEIDEELFGAKPKRRNSAKR